MTIELHLLGEIGADIDGHLVDVGHMRQRCVLAALLVDANRVVPVDHLLDRAWGERQPQRARGTLRSYLSRLRQVLAPAAEVDIVRRSGGYVVAVDPEAVDLYRFRRLTELARGADDDQAASELLAQALELWRGEAFAGLDTPWVNAARETLDAQRLAAQSDLTDISLRLGRHAEILGDLSASAAADPWNERLAAQRMLALYRSGRQTDALECYQQMWRRLAEELGTDPGPQLRQLHHQMLTADPALAAPTRTAKTSARVTVEEAGRRRGRVPVPHQLPAAPSTFTGRAVELAELSKVVDAQSHAAASVAICAISGSGGIGKTWLALKWANNNVDRFPDGQLYVNLRGFDPMGEPVTAAAAMRGFLNSLGVDPAQIPSDPDAQAGLYRSLVAGQKMLIVLDNARDSGTVVPLLPGTATCAVLITSRRQLASLVTAHGARPLALDVLSAVEAHDLLARQLGTERIAEDQPAVSALLRHCAGLPLALGIMAARAALQPELPLAGLAVELESVATRLDALGAGELPVDLRAVLSCSIKALTAEAARLFAVLGIAPGPDISLAAAASLAARPAARIRGVLRELVVAHLIQEHAPGRFRMHDLVRLYSTETGRGIDAGTAQRRATHRVLDHYVHTAYAAARLLNPTRLPIRLESPAEGVAPEHLADDASALAWFIDHHAVLLAALSSAAETGFDTHTWRLAWALANYLERQGHWPAQLAAQRAAVAAAERLSDEEAQANAHRGLANAYGLMSRYDDADAHMRRALNLFGGLGHEAGQAHANIGLGWLLARQGRLGEALQSAHQALDLFRTAGDTAGQANALNNIGWYHAQLGQYAQALTFSEQGLALFRDVDRFGEATAWDSMGYAHHHLDHHEQSIACYRRALTLFRELRIPDNEAEVLTHLGDAQHAGGHSRAADRSWQEALTILVRLGRDEADTLRAKLGRSAPVTG